MHDPLVVRRSQPPRDLHAVGHRAPRTERCATEDVAKGRPFEQLEHHVGETVSAHVEDGEDARMVEGGHCPRLPLEALEAFLVLRHLPGQDLDRHVPSQAPVARAVHLAHAARAEGSDDLVRSQAESGRKGHQ